MKTLFCYCRNIQSNKVVNYHPLFGRKSGLRRLITA